MKTKWIIGVTLLAVIGSGAAHADSLWKASSQASLFTDKKARKVGDLITIVINETATSSQQANTSVSKKADNKVGPGVGPILKLIPALGFGGDSSHAAQGSTSRSTNLTARISAKVIEVKPNGNLVIEGTRNITTSNDTQIMKLTGLVRQEDVQPDNTALSSAIADAKIDYTGKGPISEKQKPGFITRVLKSLF
jgi:flagellar L-ring protein precursor FlgH